MRQEWAVTHAPPRRRAVIALTLAALTVLALVLVAEVAVRVITRGGDDYAIEMWRYARRLKRASATPGLGHEHVPGASARLMGVDVRINARGLRERDIDHARPPGVRRVLMLGDSLTFGWGVAVEDTASRRLEARLRDDDPAGRWQVINAGVGNYNTRMEVRYLLAEGLRYEPEVVVLNYFLNDAEEDPRYAGNAVSERFASYVFLTNRLDALARRVTGRGAWGDYYRALYRDDAPGWRGAREALATLGRTCAARSLRCLVLDQPELHRLEPYPFADVSSRVAAACAAAGLPYVDARPALRGLAPASLWVSPQDAHPNATAQARYAEVIAAYLRAHPTP